MYYSPLLAALCSICFCLSCNKCCHPHCHGVTRLTVNQGGPAGYLKYNVVAKKLDRRLAALGAGALLGRGLGDDQHPSGYEAALDPWLRALWPALRARFPLPPGASEVPMSVPAASAIPPSSRHPSCSGCCACWPPN